MSTSETKLVAVEEVILCEKGRYLVEHNSFKCFCNERKFSERDGPRVGFLSSGVIRACLNAEEKAPL